MPNNWIKKNERKILKRLVSWNVNGIRACVNKGFIDFIGKYSPDIICLQEIKANEDQFPPELMEIKGYNFFIHSAKKKGYSGVAVLSKEKPTKVVTELSIEGRLQILTFKNFILFNCYFPNGQRDHARVDYKLEFYDEVLKLYKKYTKQGHDVIITGDFNTAHHPIDLANPKSNKKTTGFLEHEREWLDKYLNAGMVDALRIFHPEEEGHYTWWTYRGDCRARNIGWRIDYFMISEALKKKAKSCYHLPQVLGSDHCPIVLEL